MKKIIIISTKVEVGEGGISTALVGYINGLKLKGVDFDIIASHDQNKNTVYSWFRSFIFVSFYTLKYREKAIFWFHCGPWLSTFRKASLAVFPRLLGCETVGHIHSPTFYQYLNGQGFLASYIKLCLTPFSKLCMLTPWWNGLLGDHSINKKSFISPNPNNIEYCDIAKEYLKCPKTLNVKENIQLLSMSRLVEGKGVDVVIKTLALLPNNYHLVIAGDGPLKSEFEGLVNKLDLGSRVEFKGWVNGDEKKQLLCNSDIFCLPSTYDSFGMVFIEAMACDLPVIAYGWGPIYDVVTPDVGVCCKEPCVENVLEAITHITNNLESYSGKGPKRVIERYTPERIVDDFCKNLE